MADTRHERLTRLRNTAPAVIGLVLFTFLIGAFAAPQICGGQSLQACARNVGRSTVAPKLSPDVPATTQPTSEERRAASTRPIESDAPVEATSGPSTTVDREPVLDPEVSFDLLEDHPSSPVVIGVTTRQTPGDLQRDRHL